MAENGRKQKNGRIPQLLRRDDLRRLGSMQAGFGEAILEIVLSSYSHNANLIADLLLFVNAENGEKRGTQYSNPNFLNKCVPQK